MLMGDETLFEDATEHIRPRFLAFDFLRSKAGETLFASTTIGSLSDNDCRTKPGSSSSLLYSPDNNRVDEDNADEWESVYSRSVHAILLAG
ncbi:unnamed protein product, partial [Amoebophrya sp. A25]|eukprot:GSA25T00001891001.1